MSRLSWILSFLLLLVGALAVPGQASAETPPALDRFESSIVRFERNDRKAPPAGGSTLFIGSSTFTLWGKGLEKEFAQFQALNRGFGGATIPEINHYVSRIVTPYRPRAIVFYAGTNDIAEGHSATQVCDDFQTFVKLARAAANDPKLKIAFISMSIPPSREKWAATYKEANGLIKQFVQSDSALYYIDVSTLLLDAAGHPRREFFRIDALHMRPSGYALWIPHIRETLEAMNKK